VFILGTARSGSTALAEMVASACGLDLARGKESHYLASAALQRPTGGPDGARFDRLRARSKQEFDALFSRGGAAVRLDASTSSLYYAESAVAVLDEFFPDARLVAVLRDPVTRALSAHRFMRARGLETLSFADALEAEETRVDAGWSHIWHYARTGVYSRQLEALSHWRERTLFLLYERDLADPAVLARRVSEHIGQDVVNPVELLTRNAARPFVSPKVGRAAEWLHSQGIVRRAPAPVRAVGRRAVARLRDSSLQPEPALDIGALQALYRGEASRVSSLTHLAAQEVWTIA
jgi:hypothetical protein